MCCFRGKHTKTIVLFILYHVFRNARNVLEEDQPHLVLFAVHLKDGDVCLPVDLVSWRVLPHALGLEETEETGER